MATAANVRVGVTGAVAYAPTGTTLPTDATTSLNVAFDDIGYVGEDGVTQSMSTDVNEVKAWQNGDVVRKIQTSHDLTYSFKMLETSAEVLAAYYGNGTAAGAQIKGDQLAHKSWVIDVVDGDELIRVVIPDGQITERGDVVYAGADAIGYEVTITAYPDNSQVKAYLYLGDAVS